MLPLQGAWVQYLVRELGSHKLWGQKKRLPETRLKESRPCMTLILSASAPLKYCYKVPHQILLGWDTIFKGRSQLYPPLPGIAIKLLFSASPRTLSPKFNLAPVHRGQVFSITSTFQSSLPFHTSTQAIPSARGIFLTRLSVHLSDLGSNITSCGNLILWSPQLGKSCCLLGSHCSSPPCASLYHSHDLL